MKGSAAFLSSYIFGQGELHEFDIKRTEPEKTVSFRPIMADNDLLSNLVVSLSYIAFKGGIVMTESVTKGMVKFDIHTNF